MDLTPSMQPTTSWRLPLLLPDCPDVAKAQLDSKEYNIQEERMKSVVQARFVSEYDVPNSPAPLSDVEQALDMTSQASAVIAVIPFFVPPPLDIASPAPALSVYPEAQPMQTILSIAAPAPAPNSAATPELVLSLGLPMFLVGQPVQALETLASSPGLLNTLVDQHGMYDQPRLLSLVQTLSSSPSLSVQPSSISQYQMPMNSYSAPLQGAMFAPAPAFAKPPSQNGFKIRKSDEGNLHVSGYGQHTTESELIAAFAPYVHVDEVVMKGTFAFVNTSDPINALRAKEALTGTLIGGLPVRINNATRKNREQMSHYGGGVDAGIDDHVAPRPSFPVAGANTSIYGPGPSVPTMSIVPPQVQNPGMPPSLSSNVDSVRDDRGNPATKNLFIAGYGPSTTEQQLRDLVSQFAIVTGVVLKGSFSFVNTTDRSAAVLAREMLQGTTFNGGPLRINFAKETGRLGTSFDLTYGPNTGPNANRGPPQATSSYYGRSY
jgi:RNA recognition motif-containing protein